MLAIVAVCVLAIDQFAKYLVIENLEQGDVYDVLGQVLQFRFVKNPGAAFSLLSGSTWIFAIIASAVAVFIVVFARRIRSLPWAVLFGLLLGGNLGNLTDRLFREPGFGVGHVIDYIQIIWFPAIFNIADMAIVFSMAIFILLTIRSVPLTGVKPVAGDDASTAALLAEPAPDVAADAAPAPTPDPADDSPATGRP